MLFQEIDGQRPRLCCCLLIAISVIWIDEGVTSIIDLDASSQRWMCVQLSLSFTPK